MRVLSDIQDKLVGELEEICAKRELSYFDLKIIYKIVDVIKDITTIEAMHKADSKPHDWSDADTKTYSHGDSLLSKS